MAARPSPRSVPDPDLDAAEGLDRGVEHLQTAAHEMIAAARSFLDVVEDVVSDREKLRGVADAVTELVASAGGSLARVADRVTGTPAERGSSADGSGGGGPRVRRIPVD